MDTRSTQGQEESFRVSLLPTGRLKHLWTIRIATHSWLRSTNVAPSSDHNPFNRDTSHPQTLTCLYLSRSGPCFAA